MMPKAKPIGEYPWETYWTVFKAVAETERDARVPISGIHPMTLRGELYAFRRACQRDPIGARARGIDLGMLDMVVIRVEKDHLLVQHKNRTSHVQALVQALAEQGFEVPKTGPQPTLVEPLEAGTGSLDAAASLEKVLRATGQPLQAADSASAYTQMTPQEPERALMPLRRKEDIIHEQEESGSMGDSGSETPDKTP